MTRKPPIGSQEDGSHYQKLEIQPIEFCFKNKLDVCQSKIVKYVTRFRDKKGLVDLIKARHVLDILIYYEYGQEGLKAIEEYENKFKENEE